MTTLTLLHPGSMGAAIAEQAQRGGTRVLWVPDGRSEATTARARKLGLQPRDGLEQALRESDLAVSVCPPQAARDVAAQVARCSFRGVFVEANAVSPDRVTGIAALFRDRGAAVVDAAVFGPPPTGGRKARLYAAGDQDGIRLLAETFQGTSVDVRGLDGDIGSASALKMAFAGFQKAARTLAGVAHALARVHGVGDELTAEAEVMASDILSDPDYLPSVAARAWRWGPEMQEIAASLRAADLPDDLARAAVGVLGRWEADKDRWDLPLDAVLAHLRTRR